MSKFHRDPLSGAENHPGKDPSPANPPPKGPRTPYPVDEPDLVDKPGSDPDYLPGRSPEPGTM